jgi:hypothetical protein
MEQANSLTATSIAFPDASPKNTKEQKKLHNFDKQDPNDFLFIRVGW